MADQEEHNIHDFDKEQSLMQASRKLLGDHELDFVGVTLATGIPYHWLSKFSAGEFKNPSVNRVQCLYEFLTGTKIIEE